MKDYAALFGDRAIDAEVAEVVFGAKVWHREGFPGRPRGRVELWMTRHSPHQELPYYSTDRDAAMDVFFEALTIFGIARIEADMEDYAREPGDIVSITLGFEPGATWQSTGDFAPTMCALALEACRDQVEAARR